ncbi:MAG: VTT domain-containing protein [Bryobacterales bacterium]|nr:VTT domain-containing protein [Bryobacterales bacterium]
MPSSRLPWIAAAMLAAILIPFFLWEEPILAWFETWRAAPPSAAMAALLAALLAADILLPVPSSLVSTAAGALLGFLPGALVSWAGMTAGSFIGYALGRGAAASRWLPEADRARLARAQARYGDWLVIVFRSVPVLAEASAVFAGAAGMARGRFFTLAALANLGISLVYAGAGAFAAGRESFLLALAAAVALPGVAMLLVRRSR